MPAHTNGVHTYSVGMVLTYKQYKKIWDTCYKTGDIIDTSNILRGNEKLYCYAYYEQGIKIYLHGRPGTLYRLRVQMEPCRVLSYGDPTALAKLDKKQYKELVKTADQLLHKLEIPVSVDKMKISRCDLTENVECTSREELMEYLRICQKGLIIPHYTYVFFEKSSGKAKNCKTANQHSHCLSCKSANFLIYDKVAQLEMIDRYDETLAGKHVLRFEAELKRAALKKQLGKAAMETNYKLLSTAAHKSTQVICWYLNRMQPRCENYVRYEDAVSIIKDAGFKGKTEQRMLYLLRKASDSTSLTAALEKMKKKYSLTKGQQRTILKKFEKLGISPITLTNVSPCEYLPSVQRLF